MGRPPDYAAAYARRNQLARQRGFRSYGQQRWHARRPSKLSQILDLPQAARDVRSDALRAIDLAREKGISPEQAASQLGVPMSAVRWWGVESLGRTRTGRTQLTRRDALRMRPVAFEGGVEFVAARGWKRKEIERVFQIQWAAAQGLASDEDLDWLRGRTIGHRRVSDAKEQLLDLARRGELDPMEVYRGLVS